MEEEAVLRQAKTRLLEGKPIDPALQVQVDTLFARYRVTMVRLCTGWARNAQRGEELAQEGLVEAWGQLTKFQFEGSFQSFIIAICRNKYRNARRRISELLTEDGVLDPASELAGALGLLRDDEQEAVLLSAIAELPQIEQDALQLRYVDGVSVNEITLRLAVKGTSGARGVLQSARRHLDVLLRGSLATMGHGSSFFRTSVT